MTEFWETAFTKMQTMWGLEPTASALAASEQFARAGFKDVLIPGIGYGRNAKAFLERGMSVTGIEISETAIAIARSKLELQCTIHHGSVSAMPFDAQTYGGIFCHGLLYLLDEPGRAKLIADCNRQLTPAGQMVFTLISKEAPMYAQGPKLGEDWYERLPGLPMFFYDEHSVRREFGAHAEISKFDEPSPDGTSFPFLKVVCKKV
jgi:SAM-dependent methyltransferase